MKADTDTDPDIFLSEINLIRDELMIYEASLVTTAKTRSESKGLQKKIRE